MLVDPGIPYELMKDVIYNRRGVSINQVKAVFLTHFHGDHVVELSRYEQCRIYASAEEIELNASSLPAGVEPLKVGQFAGISPVLLPGHTMGITGLSFVSDGFKVLVAGDIVMTKDFYLAGEGFHNTVDENALKESLRRAGEDFHIIVPGHDVQFLTRNPMK